jgi:hypothetical protein
MAAENGVVDEVFGLGLGVGAGVDQDEVAAFAGNGGEGGAGDDPSIVRSLSVPPAMSAPVLPQLTTTRASPSFTSSMARTIEESFFFLPASGLSSIVMTSEAWNTETFSFAGH